MIYYVLEFVMHCQNWVVFSELAFAAASVLQQICDIRYRKWVFYGELMIHCQNWIIYSESAFAVESEFPIVNLWFPVKIKMPAMNYHSLPNGVSNSEFRVRCRSWMVCNKFIIRSQNWVVWSEFVSCNEFRVRCRSCIVCNEFEIHYPNWVVCNKLTFATILCVL